MERGVSMIDIHSHILPGIDDGAKNIQESINIARQLVAIGVKYVIATPHYIPGDTVIYNGDIEKKLDELNYKLKELDILLDVFIGNEAYMDMKLVEHFEEEKFYSLNDGTYVLIEFPMYSIPEYSKDLFKAFLEKGYRPIIAHPERNREVMKDPNVLCDYIDMGVLCQLNFPSLMGNYGSEVKEIAKILLDLNMIHVLGNDIHHSLAMNVEKYKEAMEEMRHQIGWKKFIQITEVNNECVMSSKPIIPFEYKRYIPVTGFKKFMSSIGAFFK